MCAQAKKGRKSRKSGAEPKTRKEESKDKKESPGTQARVKTNT